MTLNWLEEKMREFEASCGRSPEQILMSQDDLDAITADLFSSKGHQSITVDSVPVSPGFACRGDVYMYGGGYCSRYSYVPPVACASTCDCGAAKTNQPGHSFWCSAQELSA